MKQEELDPDKRLWEYDGDGIQIYKLECGFGTKTLWDGGHAFYMKKLVEHDQSCTSWNDRMEFWGKINGR
jgi:hypothetical protein